MNDSLSRRSFSSRFRFGQIGFVWLLSLAFASAALEAPDAVAESFGKKYGDRITPIWEIDANGNWEAGFTSEGKEYRADFTEDGTWIETERTLIFDDLPPQLRAAIEKEYSPREIVEIEEVEHSSRGLFYDVELSRPDGNEDVVYNEAGEKLNPILAAVTSAVSDFNTPLGDLSDMQKSPGEIGRLELIFEFGLNLITIFVYAYGIYYLRHHNHKMMFLLLAFNLFLFPIFLLNSVLTAGFGFTIFALLALVRLRSENFDKAEVAYLLGAVALTFINSILPANIEIIASVLVLGTAFVADHPMLWRSAYQTTEIRYKISDTTRMLDREYLREKISEEFQIEVNDMEIERIAKNEVRMTVMYRDLPQSEKPDPPVSDEAEKADPPTSDKSENS